MTLKKIDEQKDKAAMIIANPVKPLLQPLSANLPAIGAATAPPTPTKANNAIPC